MSGTLAVEGPGAGPGSGLLGNMSSRPRSEITRVVPPVQRTWVLFDRASLHRGRDTGVLSDVVLARLDRRWRELGLTGATVVSRSSIAVPGVTPLVCLDRDLILNVLLRVRGDVLIHRMPLLDRIDPMANGRVLCADPRLHAAVHANVRRRRK